MKMEQTECFETSAYKIQTPGNYPEESIQHTEHGESLKSRSKFTKIFLKNVCKFLQSYRPCTFVLCPLVLHPYSCIVLIQDVPGVKVTTLGFNPLKPELNPICYLLALLGAHHFLHVSRIRVKLLTLRRLVSYIYGAPILDVSRSHTTTQHSR